jgi:anti-sigma factor RsiW
MLFNEKRRTVNVLIFTSRSPFTIKKMNCQEFRQNISLYIDGTFFSSEVRAAFDAHLEACPVCRTELVEMTSLRRNLQILKRPQAPTDLTEMLRRSVAIELAGRQAVKKPAFTSFNWKNWCEFNLMPYAVGTLASVLFFVMMFAALRTAMTTFRDYQADRILIGQTGESSTPIMIASAVASNRLRQADTNLPFSAADYAALRSPYALESPSLNPKSAFVAFTSSLTRGEMSDEAVVIVADVFSNGIAKVADVIEAPHDRQKLDELERILNNEPAFVPAVYDKRPENMRVVILIQKVDVRDEQNDSKASRKF